MYLVQGGVNVARMTIEHAGAYGAVISDKFGDEHVPGTPCGTDDTPLSFGGPAGPFTIGADSFQLEGLLSDATWATGGCAAGSPYDYLIYDGEPIVKVTVESLGGAVGPCPLPSLASFSPTSGSFGTSIVLRGSSFIGVTGVAFDGSPAASFSVDSPTQITATLPRSATTGDVSVTTANGTASSTSRFTVTHRSALTIRLRHSKGDLVATGTVRIPDGTQHCWGERLVVVEGRVSHQWHALGTLTTHPDGSFAGRVRPADGWIRGRVKQRRLAGGDICEPAEGNVRAHGLV
jgi:hypothetical protein